MNICSTNNNNNTMPEPFSFQELSAPTEDDDSGEPVPTSTTTVKASDGVDLAVHVYEPPNSNSSTKTKTTALVLYHGGGAHALAGYPHIGKGLARKHGITVYLPDLRGHGTSGGPRGDAPSPQQVWRDIDSVLAMVDSTHQHSKIFLGGHSSGGGLVVNYATAHKKDGDTDSKVLDPVELDGYVLVAPELGYLSKTARPGRTDFASVRIWPFIVNAIFGWLANYKAVRFHYPAKLLEDDPGMVGFNTVGMANAITPESPREQLSTMTATKGAIPVALWVGADDELFTAEKVAAFVDTTTNHNNVAEVLPEKNHLGILVDIHEPIGQWIGKLG